MGVGGERDPCHQGHRSHFPTAKVDLSIYTDMNTQIMATDNGHRQRPQRVDTKSFCSHSQEYSMEAEEGLLNGVVAKTTQPNDWD